MNTKAIKTQNIYLAVSHKTTDFQVFIISMKIYGYIISPPYV